MPNDSFIADVANDREARVRTLALLRTIPTRYTLQTDDVNLIRRCALPIIYAEWEGFFVNALSLFFREISNQGVSLDRLNQGYLIRELEKNFRQFNDYPTSTAKKHSFFVQLIEFLRNTENISLRTDVNTESNLGFDVTNGILGLLHLEKLTEHPDNNEYSIKEDLDRFLLNTRNGIAHGNYASPVTDTHITKAVQLVTRLMDMIIERLEKGLRHQVYLQ